MKKDVILTISAFAGGVIGGVIAGEVFNKKYGKMKELSEKYLALFMMMNRWVRIKQEGKHLADYLKKIGLCKVAIYGMGYVGETLLEELKGTEVEVAYGIDRRADGIKTDIDIFFMDASLKEVDAVIVTAISSFDEIEDKLTDKLNCPIISLEDIVLYEDYMGCE